MGFRVSLIFTLFAMFCDFSLLSIRVGFGSGGVAGYALLAFHEAVLLALALLLASFILRTHWLVMGALRDILRLLRVVGSLWFLRVALAFLPMLYKEVVLPRHHTGPVRRAWTDAGYGILFCLNVVIFLLFNVALLHAICFLSDKRLYTHLYSAYQAQVVPVAADGRGNPLERRTVHDPSLPVGEMSIQGMSYIHSASDRGHYFSPGAPVERRRL